MQLGGVLISESQIADAVGKLADRVSRDYDLSKVVLVGAMDGAVCFLSDLMRAFAQPVDVTTVRMRRYDGTEGGEVTVSWLPLRDRIEGREVLIVEGIVDTGETCAVLSDRLSELGAASVDVCALLDKPSRRTHDVKASYIGFEVPDVFVVGYGMDYNGAYRSLRDVCVLEGGESELN
ncbi:MAG: hypoxanthine phosphoribosyltransferase [Dehalococcoidia bacterium]|nr:hypoxanthine phosphoribosyltransferase [Dehalococcoidia bacterium]